MRKNNFKSLIAGILFLLLVVGSLFFILRQIKNYKDSFMELSLELKNKEERNNEIKSLNKVIAEIGEDISILESHFLNNGGVSSFFDELEKKAKIIGVKAEVVSVNKNIENTQTSLSLIISANGEFEALKKFLLLLENSKYEIEITSLDLNKEFADPSSGVNFFWKANIGIKVISFIDN